MNLRQAAQVALSAIEDGASFDHLDNVVAPMLRAALAEPEQTIYWEDCEQAHPECKEMDNG